MAICLSNVLHTPLQDVFDTIVTHLRTQNAVSLRARHLTNACAYRGDNGMKCAVGCIIADDEYSPDMEGRCAYSVISQFCSIPTGGYHDMPEVLHLLSALQSVHDLRSVEKWEKAFKDVACEYNLTYTPVRTSV